MLKLKQFGFACLLTLLMLPLVASAGETVDINNADAANLSRVLQGIGAKKAADIVEDRQKNGLFQSPYDLTRIKGIGSKTVEKNLDKIVVGKPASDKSASKPKPEQKSGDEKPKDKPAKKDDKTGDKA